jgi:hypothetical protein
MTTPLNRRRTVLLCLLGGLAVAGCATDQRQFYWFRDTDVAPLDAGPALTKATLRLYTGAQEKLPTTGVWVLVTDSSGQTTVARVTNIARSTADRYTMSSIHEINLPLDSHKQDRALTVFYKEGLHRPRFSVGIMANSTMIGTQGSYYGFEGKKVFSGYGGENRWSFDATLILTFSDGSTIDVTHVGQQLNSQQGELVMTKLAQ